MKKNNSITYNIAQLIFKLSLPIYDKIYMEWGRGTGKSTILGGAIKSIVIDMPRCSLALVGESYQQILTRTLPSTIQGLEQHGLLLDVHYFVGRAAPRHWNWPKSYQPPRDLSRAITFWNGSIIHLISQDKKGDGRGLNIDGILGDEAALLNKEILDETIIPALRGSNVQAFEGKKYFAKEIYASSTPLTLDGKWFTDMEDIAMIKPDKVKFLKADYRVNAHNLRKGFIESAKTNTIPWVFDAEYLNIRPNRTKNMFYSLLSESKHTYSNFDYSHYTDVRSKVDSRGDADCIPNLPIIIGVDFGASINCLVALQEFKSINEIKALKSMFVLGDNYEIQDDLADKYIDYYQNHIEKVVYFWYDNSGNNRTGNTRLTKAQQFAQRLRAAGWKVIMMTKGGTNPQHDLKHRLWEMILSGDHPSLPRFLLNKPNCRELFISMSNAKTVTSSSGHTLKDKSAEKSKKVPRQLATDLSDAIDAVIVGMYIQYVFMNRLLPA